MTEPSATGPDGAVAVVGEALVDLVQVSPAAPFEALVGGSPANVAVGLARLGVPTRLAARIGQDCVAGTADWQWRADEIAGAFDEVVAVHAGSLALTMEPGAEVLIGALARARARATSTVSYEPPTAAELAASVDAAPRTELVLE